jgi:Na+-transporting methylmalonyl-CoA/oxaloacetate decarboxylase gamma subunit
MMMDQNKRNLFFSALMLFTLLCVLSRQAHAAGLFAGEDVEKPKPRFTRTNKEIVARLIPRAKSTSVSLAFAVNAGGSLEDVSGVDFVEVDRPEVDIKNFKSAAFRIGIKTAPGKAAQLDVRSDFFTQSTSFYIFNPKRPKPWLIPAVENSDLGQNVRQLRILVTDGGDYDADGKENGHITVIGGPRDSFWGYALGTLFIRFFGIFIVLGILMIGMLLSGYLFKVIEKDKRRQTAASAQPSLSPPAEETPDPSDEIAAVIAAAVHLHRSTVTGRPAASLPVGKAPESGWAVAGRQRTMDERRLVFNRTQWTRHPQER